MTNLHPITHIKGLYAVKVPTDERLCFETDPSDDSDYKILGTITADDCSFDCEPYVEESKDMPGITHAGEIYPVETYYDYDIKSFWLETALESFRSAMAVDGLIFVNPMGEEPLIKDYDGEVRKFDYQFNLWQSYESKVSPKWLILEIQK